MTLAQHPFSPQSVAAESGAETKSDRSYRLFTEECERLLGHSLDGDDVDMSGDGFSLDEAHDVWRRGESAHAYVAMIVSRDRYVGSARPKNFWKFCRETEATCVVKDKSGTIYARSHGDLAAHYCQDFMRWTQIPAEPGGRAGEPFALKPSS